MRPIPGYRKRVHKVLSRLRRPRVVDRERAVVEERLRIARELHDVVAHSVSEMVVQASGVRCQLHADQSREREALQAVEKIGHEALSELRRMVGVMQLDGDDLSAYRIVQEALANTLKHANGAHAEVVVRYVADRVEVEIADNGPGLNGRGRTEGHTLVGMRERVALCGGTLETGPRDGGGCVVRARLPVGARA